MDDSTLHQHLDALLVLRSHCLSENPDPASFQRFLKPALQFVRILMTEHVYRRAMKSADEGEGVLLFANRIQLLSPLLSDNWPSDFSFNELVNELFGIANGDIPRMLKGAGKQGKFSNSHALVEKKLDAHLWYKVLGALGLKAAIRQNLINEHYNVANEAFQKWRKEARGKLSADYVERYLISALASSLSLAAMQIDPIAGAIEQTMRAGADYRAELARSAR